MSINKAFVVKNSFEVSTDLILADADTRRVGVGSTNPQYTLDVAGGIGATDVYVSGVGTFSAVNIDNAFISIGIITSLSGTNLNYSGISTLGILTSNQITSQNIEVSGISTFNNIVFDGYLSVGNTTGQQNQVLISTGVGVTWKTSSNLRTSTSFTATLGETTFSATYSIGYVDVYINGVKLTNTEFVATNGTSIVLNDACFGGEVVEIISFEIEYPLTFSGITLQEEGSVVGTGISAINFVGTAVTAVSTGSGSTIFVNAQLPLTSSSNVVVGIITATGRFDGNLTGNINSSGVSTVTSLVATNINASGIVTSIGGFVGALIGTATTAQGLTGTPNITVGVTTTSTLNVGTGGTIITTTSSGLIGIGTTNPTSALTVSGNVSITGVVTATTFIGALTGTASTATLATSAEGLTGTPNITVGIITATGGFVSIADTTPVTIQLVGNQLTFNAVGIGSTTLTLF